MVKDEARVTGSVSPSKELDCMPRTMEIFSSFLAALFPGRESTAC